jgi:hypothetical protein
MYVSVMRFHKEGNVADAAAPGAEISKLKVGCHGHAAQLRGDGKPVFSGKGGEGSERYSGVG